MLLRHVLSVTCKRFSSTGNIRTITEVRNILKQHVSALKESQIPLWNGTQKVGTNPMSASRDVAIIPLGSQPERRLEYLNYRDTVRFGQILEDLDTFAVWLAYKHNQAGGVAMGIPALHSPMLIVTACVDRIDMSNTKILTDNDIEMHGFVSWVGRSSIESTMTLKQNDENGISRDLLTAHFVMASRSPDGKSSVPNLGLDLQSAEEIKYFEQGKEAHSIRRERDYYSLLHVIPTEIERATMHDLFIKTLDSKDHSIRERQDAPVNSVWMRDAKLKNSIICYPFERNLYGKIFGGYIMRLALETAWANAAMFSKSRPKITSVGHINFRKSVEVGGIALFKSQVCYTIDTFLQVSVETHVLDVETQESEITNTFQFTFKADHEVPSVYPKSYVDGILYLDSKRHFNRSANLD